MYIYIYICIYIFSTFFTSVSHITLSLFIFYIHIMEIRLSRANADLSAVYGGSVTDIPRFHSNSRNVSTLHAPRTQRV